MSTAWSYTSSSPGPDPKLARAVARKLCRDSLAWARTLVVSARAPRGRRGSAPAGRNAADTRSAAGEAQLEDELFIEVLAYGLCLVEMRLSAATPAGQDGLATLVRYECSVLLSQATWRRQNRYQRLPAPNPALSDSRYAQLYPAHGAESGRQARLTREMVQQFCHCSSQCFRIVWFIDNSSTCFSDDLRKSPERRLHNRYPRCHCFEEVHSEGFPFQHRY